MKTLLLGAEGQLGWELQRSLAPLGELVALGRVAQRNPGGLCGDLCDADGLRRSIDSLRPDVIVNAAAYTQVERAEQETELALAVNGTAPGVLARQAERLGAWLIHYSTDYVFDGSKDGPWTEADATAPLNAYGLSKLAGEKAVRDSCQRHLILRTSWVHAARGGNFIRNILRTAAEKPSFDVVCDQWGAPTPAALLADASAHVLRAATVQPKLAGLYHCTASGSTHWQAYARLVVSHARACGWRLAAEPDAIGAARTADRTGGARRPLNSRLSCDRLEAAFGLKLPHWETQVRRTIDEMNPGDFA